MFSAVVFWEAVFGEVVFWEVVFWEVVFEEAVFEEVAFLLFVAELVPVLLLLPLSPFLALVLELLFLEGLLSSSIVEKNHPKTREEF